MEDNKILTFSKFRAFQKQLTIALWKKYKFRVQLPMKIYLDLFKEKTVDESVEFVYSLVNLK
jgi:hypothetical protein